MERQDSWYEKLHRWDQALEVYRKKQVKEIPEFIILILHRIQFANLFFHVLLLNPIRRIQGIWNL